MSVFKNSFKAKLPNAQFVAQESFQVKNFASAANNHRRETISVRFRINQDINK
jgi:hypothetical protein